MNSKDSATVGKKIVVLGGLGGMCTSTTIDLALNSNFEEIVIGDTDENRANSLIDMLNTPKVIFKKLDASNVEHLVGLLTGYGIVIDGLPYQFNPLVKQAAMKAQVKFLIGVNASTIDGVMSVESMGKSDRIYKEAGIGVTMSGGVPVCELMAVAATAEMDRVDEIHDYWGMSRPLNQASPAGIDTMLKEEDPRLDNRTYFKDGKEVRGVEPFGIKRKWVFPDEIAYDFSGEVYALAHSAPYMLATGPFPKAKLITSRGSWGKDVTGFLEFLYKNGLYTMDPIDYERKMVSPIKYLRDLWVHICKNNLADIRSGTKTPNADDFGRCILEVEAIGVKDGAKVRKVYTCIPTTPPSHEWFKKDPLAEYGTYVGAPTSVTACLLLDGTLELNSGLFRSTDLIKNPLIFFEELKKRGFKVYQRF
jgi:lysine 6-dehydrogenase